MAEGIFVDKQRQYGVKLFSMIIYACRLLNIFSFFLGLPIGPPLATTLLNLCLISDGQYLYSLRQMQNTTKILDTCYLEKNARCTSLFSFFF